jgi:hypothetical protein
VLGDLGVSSFLTRAGMRMDEETVIKLASMTVPPEVSDLVKLYEGAPDSAQRKTFTVAVMRSVMDVKADMWGWGVSIFQLLMKDRSWDMAQMRDLILQHGAKAEMVQMASKVYGLTEADAGTVVLLEKLVDVLLGALKLQPGSRLDSREAVALLGAAQPLTDGKAFKGKTVMVMAEAETVRRLNQSINFGFPPPMHRYCGSKGRVVEIHTGGGVRVQFATGERFSYHPAALVVTADDEAPTPPPVTAPNDLLSRLLLSHLSGQYTGGEASDEDEESDDDAEEGDGGVAIGDVVKVLENVEKVKRRLKREKVNFTDEMVKFCGHKGRVIFIDSAGHLRVAFLSNGESWWFTESTLKVVERQAGELWPDADPEPQEKNFEEEDRVQVVGDLELLKLMQKSVSRSSVPLIKAYVKSGSSGDRVLRGLVGRIGKVVNVGAWDHLTDTYDLRFDKYPKTVKLPKYALRKVVRDRPVEPTPPVAGPEAGAVNIQADSGEDVRMPSSRPAPVEAPRRHVPSEPARPLQLEEEFTLRPKSYRDGYYLLCGMAVGAVLVSVLNRLSRD